MSWRVVRRGSAIEPPEENVSRTASTPAGGADHWTTAAPFRAVVVNPVGAPGDVSSS